MKSSGCVSLLALLLFISKVSSRNVVMMDEDVSALPNLRVYVCDPFGSFISFNLTNAVEESVNYYTELDLLTYDEVGHIYIAYKINHEPTMLLELQPAENAESASCNFVGIVNGMSERSASVSVCDGLTIVVDHEVIIGEDHVVTGEGHVVHKRSIDEIQRPVQIDRSDSVELVREELSQLDSKLVLEVALVVTDQFRDLFTDHQEFMDFIFATMKRVDQYYKDPSFGVDISIQLKSLRVLNEYQTSMIDVPGNTYMTLWKFRSFKQHKNIRADAVILLSTAFSGGRAGIDQLGQTNNAGVVGWQKFETAYVVAHEIGHILGLNHPHLFCGEKSSETFFVMQDGRLGTDFRSGAARKWSDCSRGDVPYLIRNRKEHFVQTSPPAMELGTFPYPGVPWSMERQCELNVGVGFVPEVTPGMDECGWLTCKKTLPITDDDVSASWTYANIIPLEGTKGFGKKSWCVNHECRNKISGRSVVHGGWSDWKLIKKCKCGESVQIERRKCNNPRARNGGVKCQGDARREVPCVRLCEV